jgi:hypothetical protein
LAGARGLRPKKRTRKDQTVAHSIETIPASAIHAVARKDHGGASSIHFEIIPLRHHCALREVRNGLKVLNSIAVTAGGARY